MAMKMPKLTDASPEVQKELVGMKLKYAQMIQDSKEAVEGLFKNIKPMPGK